MLDDRSRDLYKWRGLTKPEGVGYYVAPPLFKKDYPMQAYTLPKSIRITAHYGFGDVFIIETDCRDYDEFSSLPAAVVHNGSVYGKSSWNSDKSYAVYRTDKLVAVGVSRD